MTQINGGAGNDIIAGTDGGDVTDISFSRTPLPVAFSPDGSTLTFITLASDIAPNDANHGYDIFGRDMLTGAVTVLSTNVYGQLGFAGPLADGGSTGGIFSPDGTMMAFESQATNLVAGDTNNWPDAFIKNLATGVVTRVSTNAAGVEGNGQSLQPEFSPDGGRVLFYSVASNLVAGDTNGIFDLFIKDLATGAVTRVNTDSAGGQAVIPNPNGPYHFSFAHFSPDGTKVVFDTGAANLVPGDTNGTQDVFVKDLVSGSLTRINTTAAGAQTSGSQTGEALFSPDGTKLAFNTNASDLGPADTNGVTDVYVKDLLTGAVTRVSTDSAGAEADGQSMDQAFLPDGSGLLINSYADNLVVGDTNGAPDVFLKDLTTGAMTRISTDAAGSQLDTRSTGGSVSADGTLVAFVSEPVADVSGNLGHLLIKNIGNGSDLITGGAGDDVIDGKGGVDTAIYSGNRADYLVTTYANGVTLVQDSRAGSPDGTDHLTNVELLRFADRTISTPAASGPPPTNRPPTPAADALSTAYHTPVTVSAASLLANDTDPDGDALSLTAVGNAQHGTVSLSGGAVTFTPYLGFVGQASFGYTVDDGHGGTATGAVSVSVTGSVPAYMYRANVTAAETIDFTGDGAHRQVVTGSGDTTVYTGPGGASVSLGAGNDTVVGGAAKDTITFGSGVDTVTGGVGADLFILVKGQIADPATHGGNYDTITDFTGAGSVYVPGRDFIYLKGFANTATIAYEHDLDPRSHLYRVDDGVYHAEFVLQYNSVGVDLSHAQYGFL